MLMVIFGAGASYDSSPDFPPPQPQGGGAYVNGVPTVPAPPLHPREAWRPPLANNLFENPGQAFSSIVRRYPKLSHILPLLRQRSDGKSVEEVLEQLQDESKGNPEGRRELTSVQYYLRDLFFEITNKWLDETDRITNYTPLIRDILRLTKNGELVCLVTFNYDLLLDTALQSYDYKSREPEEQLKSHPVLKLFKPHGAVDWARRVLLPHGELLTRDGVIEVADRIELAPDFKRFTPAQADGNPGRETFFPVIAIPLQNKTEEAFVWPSEHMTQLQKLLAHVTRILIIGWRAREAHFIGLLRNNLPIVSHIMVVGGAPSDAWETLAHFVASTGIHEKRMDPAHMAGVSSVTTKNDRELSVAPGGFSDFARNRRVIDFMNAGPPAT